MWMKNPVVSLSQGSESFAGGIPARFFIPRAGSHPGPCCRRVSDD